VNCVILQFRRWLSSLARPNAGLAAGYAAMAADETREMEAESWVDGVIADTADEPTRHSG
jgi:hypothetical protein